MVSYNDVADKADRLFHNRCRRELGIAKYNQLVPLASLAFQEGLKEPNENKRINTARRAANMVFTRELMKVNNASS